MRRTDWLPVGGNANEQRYRGDSSDADSEELEESYHGESSEGSSICSDVLGTDDEHYHTSDSDSDFSQDDYALQPEDYDMFATVEGAPDVDAPALISIFDRA